MKQRWVQRSRIAFGLAVVLLVFVAETTVADHHQPNPATRVVWAVLGIAAVVLLGTAAWCRWKAGRTA
ncbi:MAG: hypothetical protein MUF30_10070 [Burkholderiales bacterium]|nr:hypothetical protein [Burkholderiales bacterium]